ncbi:PTS sugar transporter subunit IIA [Candidatus Enterococcus murrayae]|uniref:PTS sugar transporter subunit IIA n=1 Tax=Candidatus Enterococcus murrayae TaxID=2815321 RepID=A0ABS3HCL5_9ENTE|nr:PTS sugar transporter subunit IIA [Enterococcus sp. MJM16]MBO0451189.1 PTS sugar transporter subunit IIA [Enterococcus sp. MJM16]
MEKNEKLISYVKAPLIFVQESFSTSRELFEQVYERALDMGWVRKDFLERIEQREEMFPTGIQLERFGAAIPHTDAECILTEFVAVITNKKPVSFNSMEDKRKRVNTDIVFILGLNQPHAQLEMLQSLMSLLQNEIILEEVLTASNAEQLLYTIKKNDL